MLQLKLEDTHKRMDRSPLDPNKSDFHLCPDAAGWEHDNDAVITMDNLSFWGELKSRRSYDGFDDTNNSAFERNSKEAIEIRGQLAQVFDLIMNSQF